MGRERAAWNINDVIWRTPFVATADIGVTSPLRHCGCERKQLLNLPAMRPGRVCMVLPTMAISEVRQIESYLFSIENESGQYNFLEVSMDNVLVFSSDLI